MHYQAIDVVAPTIQNKTIEVGNSQFAWLYSEQRAQKGLKQESAPEFIKRMLNNLRCAPACVLIAVVFLDRLEQAMPTWRARRVEVMREWSRLPSVVSWGPSMKHAVQKKRKRDDPDSLQCLFAVLVRIANKMVDENTYSVNDKYYTFGNLSWSRLDQFGHEDKRYTLKKWNALETQVLHVLDWNVHVSVGEIDTLTERLLVRCCASVPGEAGAALRSACWHSVGAGP